LRLPSDNDDAAVRAARCPSQRFRSDLSELAGCGPRFLRGPERRIFGLNGCIDVLLLIHDLLLCAYRPTTTIVPSGPPATHFRDSPLISVSSLGAVRESVEGLAVSSARIEVFVLVC
jgi:hypothetical protein